LSRLTFGSTRGMGSSDQSSPMLADLHLDSDDESQDPGKLQHSLVTGSFSNPCHYLNSVTEQVNLKDMLEHL